ASASRPASSPPRVVRVEWRLVPCGAGASAGRSVLEAYLADGSRSRLERLPDAGVVESSFSPEEGGLVGQLYKGRRASGEQLVRPFGAAELRHLAAACGARPFCPLSRNGHHFVRDLWNAAVAGPLRSSDCPERRRSALLRGLAQPLG
ncbi:unnamed protein product, partial [Prorocentrum cordatum]